MTEGCRRRAGLEHAEQWFTSRKDVLRRRHYCPHRLRTAKGGFPGTQGQPSPSPRLPQLALPQGGGPLQARRLPSPGQTPLSLQAADNAVFPRFSASNLDRKVLCFKHRDPLIKRQGSSASKRRGYLRCQGRAGSCPAEARARAEPPVQVGTGAGAPQLCSNRQA